MRYTLALVCGTVVLLSLVSLNAAPGNAQSGWQPRVQALESQVGELQAENAALQAQLEDLATQLDDLHDLLMHFSRDGDDVFIEGANLHVTNGLGSTDTINGLGNVIIGYNEDRGVLESDIAGNLLSRYGEEWVMLDAEVKDRIMSEETRAAVLGEENDRSGSHVLVVGTGINYSSFGGIVTGFDNSTSGQWSSVLGGRLNEASGDFSVVAGGTFNEASGESGSVSGGEGNTASGVFSSVSGGEGNRAIGAFSSVSGGIGNTASGFVSSVSEGCNRTVITCGGP